jgi:hypothetical protein
VVGEPLGPAEGLVDVLVERLVGACAEAGLAVSDLGQVVLAAAGTSRAAGTAAVEDVAAQLAGRLGRPVHPGYASAARPRTACAVTLARTVDPRPVGLATYLLAPGLFSQRTGACGAEVVAEPLAVPHSVPATLVELVLERYRGALAGVRARVASAV